MQNKDKPIFDPNQRYQDARNLLQNPKVCKNHIDFNNCTQSLNTPYYPDVDGPFDKYGENKDF